jgi:hypothetical protein
MVIAMICGCHAPGTDHNAATPYLGPTEPMAKVVAEINANNAAIPTIWARDYFAGMLVDEQKHIHHVNAEGLLLMSKPASIRLVGNKPGVTLFDMGTDGKRFWMSVPIEVDTMWWGNNKNIDRPCAQSIPIQPEGILEVLGVGEFDAANLNQPPVPVMRFEADADAYVFIWNHPQSDHWAATKEVWYDRTTKRAFRVRLFDPNGRVAMEAELSDNKQIAIDGQPKEKWPWLARVYRLSFPDSGSKITLSLVEVYLRSEEGAPTERSFVMPNPQRAGVSKVVQIDEACGQ